MTADFTHLKEDLDKDLAAHHQSPSDVALARTALETVQLLLERWAERGSEGKSKTEGAAPKSMRFMDILIQYQYLQKVCQTLSIRDTYGPDLYRHHIILEMSDIQDFLRLHLKIAPPSAMRLRIVSTPGKKEIAAEADNPTWTALDPLIQPYLLYRQFVEREKAALEAPAGAGGQKQYQFIKSQSAGLELLEGLHETDSIRIDGLKPSLADLAAMWENIMGQSINNLYHKKRVILSRKKDQTPYLTEMITAIKTKPEPGKKKSSPHPKGPA